MEAEVLRTVSSWRFTPATRDGKPVAIHYQIPIRLELDAPADGTSATAFDPKGMTRPVPDPTNPMPRPSSEDRDHHLNGTFLVMAVISADGEVSGPKVIKSPEFGGPPAALKRTAARMTEMISRWRFKPATRDGKPVAVKYVVPVRFVLP
jgi:protein TonB